MSDLEVFRQFVREVTVETGVLIRHYWEEDGLRVERKADDSPVTVA